MNGRSCKRIRLLCWGLAAAAAWLLSGCAHYQPPPQESELWVYKTDGSGTRAAENWAPAFVAYDHAERFNRIGRPVVRDERDGNQSVTIDTQTPVAYFMRRTFTTDKATYTNLIYRVHFPKIPFSLIPFNLSAGKNVGLIVVVTLNADNQPLLVTTVHTCGCYKAIVPTQYLPREDFPVDWSGQGVDVYGEHLPALLKFEGIQRPQILVYLRPDVHRVMDLGVRDVRDLSAEPFRTVPMPVEPMEALDHLPAESGTTSFYYPEGVLMSGHVKGALKPWETLLLSLISLDPFVGTDKAYADSDLTGSTFYTSLKPWRREDSDMWHFARFLHYWGWRL